MIETLIIVGLIMLIIGSTLYLFTDIQGLDFLLSTIGAYILSGGLMMLQENRKPSAMDVYRGKTTLEITYRDGVAVDSVVVFKDKKK